MPNSLLFGFYSFLTMNYQKEFFFQFPSCEILKPYFNVVCTRITKLSETHLTPYSTEVKLWKVFLPDCNYISYFKKIIKIVQGLEQKELVLNKNYLRKVLILISNEVRCNELAFSIRQITYLKATVFSFVITLLTFCKCKSMLLC